MSGWWLACLLGTGIAVYLLWGKRSAALAWPDAALIALGAILFFTSDALLAWNRFVAPIARGKMLVIVAYHLGQMLLILGAVRMVEVFPGILSGYAALVSSLK